jgi:hypothetical protein
MIFDVFPWPTGLGYRSQIGEGPVSGPSPVQTPQNRHEKNKYMDACFYAIKYHKTDLVQTSFGLVSTFEHTSMDMVLDF